MGDLSGSSMLERAADDDDDPARCVENAETPPCRGVTEGRVVEAITLLLANRWVLGRRRIMMFVETGK